MKKIFFLFIFGLAFQGSTFALLPPLWEDVKEIKAILDDPQIGNLLQSGENILDISKTGKGWTITTNHNVLSVTIVYEKQTIPGPAKFSLQFETPKPSNP